MNREIKFRGKTVNGNKWVYGDLLHIAGGYIIYHGSQKDCEITTGKHVSVELLHDEISVVVPETVGQFTGLLDKNGKEIYEGDILNNGQRNYFVCWNSERGAWWLKSKDLIYTTPLGFLSIELFVVGNIYDNPDLIKEE